MIINLTTQLCDGEGGDNDVDSHKFSGGKDKIDFLISLVFLILMNVIFGIQFNKKVITVFDNVLLPSWQHQVN